MIKGISILRRAEDGAVYDRLSSFFAAMGFAVGGGWKDTISTGASFLAPLGNLEFVNGQFPAVSDLMVEVTSLDAAHQAAERWLRSIDGEPAIARLSSITETHWKSNLFTVEPEPGFSFTFWAWTNPTKAKPIAVE